MKKVISLCLLVLLPLTLTGCSQKPHTTKVYMYNWPQKTASELIEVNVPSYSYPWSYDSKHFFISDKYSGIHLFNTDSMQEIILPGKDIEIGELSAGWVDNNHLLINNYKNDISDFSLYDTEKKSFDNIAESGGIYKLQDDISQKEETFRNRYTIGDLYSLLKNDNIYPIECIYSIKRDKALYSVNDYETYLLDLKTNEKKYLFRGLNFDFSPSGSKIRYCLPKDFTNFNFEKYASGDKFETYVYDIDTGKSIKIADFHANTQFSYDDKRIIFYQDDYLGAPYE